MSRVEEIQHAIESLSAEEFWRLAEWMREREEQVGGETRNVPADAYEE